MPQIGRLVTPPSQRLQKVSTGSVFRVVQAGEGLSRSGLGASPSSPCDAPPTARPPRGSRDSDKTLTEESDASGRGSIARETRHTLSGREVDLLLHLNALGAHAAPVLCLRPQCAVEWLSALLVL
jgi:hypothetical protein